METYFYNSHKYDDIMGLPHHVSASRPHMPRGDRAAQFSPFSALSGFGAAIRETGRQTDPRIGLSEDDRAVLDANLQMIQEKLADRPEAEVTYFQPDDCKSGGSYCKISGRIRKIDACGRILVMENGTRIPLDEIIGLREKEDCS
ncbi:MAG: YolD-like family protein [Lachnospiraceae bacterium]|nr:YolD-like family protein [Lachnospiraceae bacterium]MCI9388940.1 YolD-like family protein [Lachnospiraceae bacterium]